MANHSQIESFFDFLDFNWQDLLEFLPFGILFYNENWIIKSVNKNFSFFLENHITDSKLEGKNIFSGSTFIVMILGTQRTRVKLRRSMLHSLFEKSLKSLF